jgi:hypothetical protein
MLYVLLPCVGSDEQIIDISKCKGGTALILQLCVHYPLELGGRVLEPERHTAISQ